MSEHKGEEPESTVMLQAAATEAPQGAKADPIGDVYQLLRHGEALFKGGNAVPRLDAISLPVERSRANVAGTVFMTRTNLLYRNSFPDEEVVSIISTVYHEMKVPLELVPIVAAFIRALNDEAGFQDIFKRVMTSNAAYATLCEWLDTTIIYIEKTPYTPVRAGAFLLSKIVYLQPVEYDDDALEVDPTTQSMTFYHLINILYQQSLEDRTLLAPA